jgi:hypothetical protein
MYYLGVRFKKLQFENVKKFAFSNRMQGGAFYKTHDFKSECDFKCQTAILPNTSLYF